MGFSPSKIENVLIGAVWRGDRFLDGQYYWKMKRTPVLGVGFTSERGDSPSEDDPENRPSFPGLVQYHAKDPPIEAIRFY